MSGHAPWDSPHGNQHVCPLHSGTASMRTWNCAGCFLTLKVYAVSVSTLSTRAARIMREDMDTIGRNTRHKKDVNDARQSQQKMRDHVE